MGMVYDYTIKLKYLHGRNILKFLKSFPLVQFVSSKFHSKTKHSHQNLLNL